MGRSSLLRDPMVVLLVAAAGLYWLLGEPAEALFLSGAVGILFGLTVLQERRARRALQALKRLSLPTALILREGEAIPVPSEELRIGDLLILREGDRVAADGDVIEATSLELDESLLTGESTPIWGEPGQRLHAGCAITRGGGLLRVCAVGNATRAGKIGIEILEELKHPLQPTPFQKEVESLTRSAGIIAVDVCALIFVILLAQRRDWIEALLAALASGISLIPVELSLVSLITLALGAERLSREKILVRHARAIEALGSVTLLALDKTGTLTENQLTLHEILSVRQDHSERWELKTGEKPSSGISEVLEFAELASHRDPYDPLELAIRRSHEAHSPEAHRRHQDRVLIQEYPIDSRLRALTCVWFEPGGVVLATKGAPEAILELCHLHPGSGEHRRTTELLRELTEQGKRVLGVARGEGRHDGGHLSRERSTLPKHAHDFQFRFLGLIALEDPIRSTVPATIAFCESHGVAVAMLTGDHPGTALAIAKAAGFSLAPPQGLGHNVLARVSPEEKVEWVRRKIREGERVAMTGDGVNDAPSLSAAHVGIAMGSRSTEVAREAASIILLDDHFESIVRGILEGRRITQNLSRAAHFILGVHAFITLVALGPPLLGFPPLLRPVEIVFIEFVMDPSAALIFPSLPLSETAALSHDPPRLKDRWLRPVVQGAILGCCLLGTYAWNLSLARTSLAQSAARASAFEMVLVCNVLILLLALPHQLRSFRIALALTAVILLLFALIERSEFLRHSLVWEPPTGATTLRSLGPLLFLTAVFLFANLRGPARELHHHQSGGRS